MGTLFLVRKTVAVTGRVQAARAVTALHVDGARLGYRYFAEFAEQFLDLDHLGFITLEEADIAVMTAFGNDLDPNRPISTPVDERLDVDMDGRTIPPEVEIFRYAFTRAIASVPELPPANPSTPAGIEWTIWSADELSIAVTLNPVYPVLQKYYDTAPLGSVTLTNTSATALSDMEVTLSLSRYIDPALQDAVGRCSLQW